MLRVRTIKRYGEYETVWIHIKDAGDKWVVSHSRWHASGVPVLDMEYDKATFPCIASCLNAYTDFCETYYSL